MYVAKILPPAVATSCNVPAFGNHIGPGRIFARGIVEGYRLFRRLSIGHHKKFVADIIDHLKESSEISGTIAVNDFPGLESREKNSAFPLAPLAPTDKVAYLRPRSFPTW